MRVENRIDRSLDESGSVGIFYADDILSLVMSCPEIAIERCTERSDVQISCRRWRETGSDDHDEREKIKSVFLGFGNSGIEENYTETAVKSNLSLPKNTSLREICQRMKFLYTSSCSFFLLLRLSYRIPLITGILLILTAIVNIAAFQVFSEKYFTEYLSAIKENDTPDPDRIRALLQIGKLAPEDQAEYATILAELSNLSTSIENITKNPELYMSEK